MACHENRCGLRLLPCMQQHAALLVFVCVCVCVCGGGAVLGLKFFCETLFLCKYSSLSIQDCV